LTLFSPWLKISLSPEGLTVEVQKIVAENPAVIKDQAMF